MRKLSQFFIAFIVTLGLTLPLTAFQQKAGQKTPPGQSQDKKEEKKDDKSGPTTKSDDKPKPLFEGKMQLKSSRRGADSATAGFNGIDPDGKVSKDILAKSATPADAVNAQALVAYAPTEAELTKFLEEGKLNKAAAKAQTQTKTDGKKK